MGYWVCNRSAAGEEEYADVARQFAPVTGGQFVQDLFIHSDPGPGVAYFKVTAGNVFGVLIFGIGRVRDFGRDRALEHR